MNDPRTFSEKAIEHKRQLDQLLGEIRALNAMKDFADEQLSILKARSEDIAREFGVDKLANGIED